MTKVSLLLGAFAASACVQAFVVPSAPEVTQGPKLEDRATTCTFSGANGASSASKSQKSCATIVLSNVAVPSGVTLDLSDLNDGTHVSNCKLANDGFLKQVY